MPQDYQTKVFSVKNADITIRDMLSNIKELVDITPTNINSKVDYEVTVTVCRLRKNTREYKRTEENRKLRAIQRSLSLSSEDPRSSMSSESSSSSEDTSE